MPPKLLEKLDTVSWNVIGCSGKIYGQMLLQNDCYWHWINCYRIQSDLHLIMLNENPEEEPATFIMWSVFFTETRIHFSKFNIKDQKVRSTHQRYSVIRRCKSATLLKKRLWHRCFSVNFVKFVRTPFLQDTSGLLLLKSTFLVFLESF